MYTVKKYLDDIRLLANSLIIKHHDIGIVINQGIFDKYGIKSSYDYTEWKYYLNLSGMLHSTNSNVMVTTVETNTLVPLTKDIATTYPATHSKLILRLDSYIAVVDEYPNDILYINGCIDPIDIDTAIAATDGTIIGWPRHYVEHQEFSLIRELSTEIKLFFTRWYIKDYNITDELYMASVLGVLYTAIPNMISAIRTRRAKTAEVHSFHIEHFFRSHLDIWDNVRVLKPETVRWLYKNLIPLMNKVGSNETFNTIVTKILTPNNIGLARYRLRPSAMTPTNSTTLGEAPYKSGRPVIVVDKINEQYNRRTDQVALSEVIKKEIAHSNVSLYSGGNTIESLTASEETTIGYNHSVSQNTKVIDFGEIELFKIYNGSVIEVILDNWTYLAGTRAYTATKRMVDPNTRTEYRMNAMTGIILFYRLLAYRLDGSDPLTNSIKYRRRLAPRLNRRIFTADLLTANGTDIIADEIINGLPYISNTIGTTELFAGVIDEQLQLYKKIWVTDTNVNNSFLSANIKRMVSRMYREGEIALTSSGTEVYMSDILATSGINLELYQGYDVDSTLELLFKTFTGYDLQEGVLISELYSNFEILIEKLTSYTIQTIPPTINSGQISIPYTTVAAIQGASGYIKINNARIVKILEDNDSRVAGAGNNFIELSAVTNLDIPGVNLMDAFNYVQLVSDCVYDNLNDTVVTQPNTLTEIQKSSYIHFATENTVDGNPVTLPTPSVRESGVAANTATMDVNPQAQLAGSISRPAVTTNSILYAEIMTGAYLPFIPQSSLVGTPIGIPTPVARGDGNILTPNADASRLTGQLVGNTPPDIKPGLPGAQVQVLGTMYAPYVPNSKLLGNVIGIPTPAITIDPNQLTPTTDGTIAQAQLVGNAANDVGGTLNTGVEISRSTYIPFTTNNTLVGTPIGLPTPVVTDGGNTSATVGNPSVQGAELSGTVVTNPTPTTPAAFAEIPINTYAVYIPGSLGDSSIITNPTPAVIDGGVTNTVTTQPSSADIIATAGDVTVTTEPVTVVEILGNQYPV